MDRPQVGQDVTRYVGSDRSPYIVVGVSKSGKQIRVQRQDYKRTDNNGMSESQEYEITPREYNEDEVMTLSLRKNGRFYQVGRPMSGGISFTVGHASRYYDFSF